MRWICRNRRGQGARRIRRHGYSNRALPARSWRTEITCRHRVARRGVRAELDPPAASLSLRPQIEPDLLIDELQAIALAVVEPGFDHAGAHHLVEKTLHA